MTLLYPTTERGQLTYWAKEMLKAIERAIANPQPSTFEDHALLDAIRFTRCAVGHAFKVRKGLRPPLLQPVGFLVIAGPRA